MSITGSYSPYNPTVILNLLVGAGREAGRRSAQTILTSIKDGLRNEIDASLPVLYLYDAEVIVDQMLEIIAPKHGDIALGKYIIKVDGPSGVQSFSTLKKQKSKSKPDEVIKGDSDVLDIYNEIYSTLVKTNRSKLIEATHLAINQAVDSTTISIDSITTTAQKLHQELTDLIAKIVQLGVPVSQAQNTRITRVIRGIGSRIRNLTKTIAKVSDPEQFIAGFNKNTQTLTFSQNFDTSKRKVNKAVTDKLNELLKSYGISTNSTGFQAGFFAAAGHQGVLADGSLNINTPQLQMAKVILAQANLDQPGITRRFIENTEHVNWTIEVTKDQQANAHILMSLGIQVVRQQPFALNSELLSQQETNFINSELQQVLGMQYKAALDNFRANANNTQFQNYIVSEFRMQPTITEGIELQLRDVLSGKASISSFKGRKNQQPKSAASTSTINKRPSRKLQVPKKQYAKPSVTQISQTVLSANLTALQSLLNANLSQKIKENMGNGTRRDILNLRSGRFAEQAKVERLSESRQGMITAFYTYMKNPYATFSEGGRQQVPKQRDPKLLISKSIREIAAQQVSNRMRAVVI